MSNIAKTSPHTDAVVSALEAAGLLVFEGGPKATQSPAGVQKTWGWEGIPGQSEYRAYVNVTSMTGGIFDGPIGCPDDDAELLWQLGCVAETRQRCEWIADKATEALVGQPLTVEGRSVCRMQLDMTGGARPDDTVQPPVWISTPRFRATTTPA